MQDRAGEAALQHSPHRGCGPAPVVERIGHSQYAGADGMPLGFIAIQQPV